MKKVNVLAAVLVMVAVPAMAFGENLIGLQTADPLEVVGQGGLGTPWTGVMTVEVLVDADQPVSGIVYNILADAPGQWTAQLVATGSLWTTTGFGGVRNDPNKWIDSDIQNSAFLGGPASLDAPHNPESILYGAAGNVGDLDMSIFPGTALVYNLSASNLAPGTYNIMVGEGAAQQGFGIIPAGATDFAQTTAGGLTLTVLPEPASALLLLAAVPFIRRRR